MREEAARLASEYQTAGVPVLGLRQPPGQLIDWIEAGREGARRTKDRGAEVRHLGNLGIAYADLGETRRAIEHYEQQLAITHEIGDRRGEGIASWNLGEAYEKLGEFDRAAKLMQVRVNFLREFGYSDAEKDAARVESILARVAN